MDDFEKLMADEKRSAHLDEAEAAERERARRIAEGAQAEEEATFWDQARARSRQARERIGQQWGQFSKSAQDYAAENPTGVAAGALGVGLLFGLLIGLLIRRD